MILETERLLLRAWEERDAQNCYEYARDIRVGPRAGWPVHKDVEDSKNIISNILSKDGVFAICFKDDKKAIGSIGLLSKENSNFNILEQEVEIGYWIGVPFWGKGIVPEAVNCILKYAFNDLNKFKIWCGYFKGNEQSRIVAEKCGFTYEYTIAEKYIPILNEVRTEYVMSLSKEDYKKLNDER